MTASVRYGARPVVPLSGSATVAAPAASVESWATTLVATYETDPDVVAAVLPPPLRPGPEPLVRVTVATVDLGGGRPPIGAGSFAVHAIHDGVAGDWALVMPMTSEYAVVGGRERYGEPKKLADISLERDGECVTAAVTRLGTTFVSVEGTVLEEVEPDPEQVRTSFYVKFLPSPTGRGFDGDPVLVHVRRRERSRRQWRVDGAVTLAESRFDPVADLPVRALRSIVLAERASTQTGEVVATLPPEWIEPFVHQRYDDFSPATVKS